MVEFYPQIVNKYKGIKGFVSFYNFAYKIKYMVTDKAKFRAKVVTGAYLPKANRRMRWVGCSL
jgi:hypothetical protein